MKQLLQSLEDGRTQLVEVPWPGVRPHHVVVRTRASLVSTGTERMLVEFGRAGLLGKARLQPDRVRQVLQKARTDGLVRVAEAVREKLARPVPLGYCNAGVVLEAGPGVEGFDPGDAVVSNGPHAEVVCVPARLCVRAPRALQERLGEGDELFECAAFAVVGAVALQGVRLAEVSLGDKVAVIGLGLVGQLAVQILKASGCTVLGLDLRRERVELAERFGAVGMVLDARADPVGAGMELSGGRGLDAALITAATRSSAPVRQAAQMCRRRGRIVLVGTCGLRLERDEFYRKELLFRVSCSYGPGRYDPAYELKGQDYPYGLVRWTAQRNFEAVLQLMAEGRLDVRPLVGRRVPLEQAPAVYERLGDDGAGVATVLTYSGHPGTPQRTLAIAAPRSGRRRCGRPVVGVIGAGAFATRVILPLLARSNVRCKCVASRGGMDAAVAGRRFGFEIATSDVDVVLGDEEIGAVFILTPHASHASLVCRALAAGKDVFVEKPLAIAPGELREVEEAFLAASGRRGGRPLLHVGFNRRFAPLALRMRELLDSHRGPKSLLALVNAGQVDPSHWVAHPEVSGGRLVGEACHFVDLLRFFAGSSITEVHATRMRGQDPWTASIALCFADGSVGTVHYWTNGSSAYPKERVEAFCAGKVLVLENFRRLRGYGWPGLHTMGTCWRQDKGHAAELADFLRRLREGRPAAVPFEEVVEVSEACLAATGLSGEGSAGQTQSGAGERGL